MKLATSLSLVLFLASSDLAWQGEPRLCSLDAERLRQARSRSTDAAMRPAMDTLRHDADNALKAGPFSVMRKERMPPGGDKHDYLSLAPYWWPDPKSKEGLPYIRRDGETNPDSKRGTDAPVIAAMAGAVETLAIAYYFTGEERYAERASLLIRAWFLDPATKMNPNFRYAQAIPGHNDGRGAGLIESRHFIKVVDAAGLLGGSRAWTDKDAQALTAWFREFVGWMRTSPNGKDESQAKNNHGSWYATQLACYALFIGDKELARKTAEAARDRIAWQIEPDGKQPQELQRTRALGYSAFNLVALMTLAEAGIQVGVDLYAYQTKDGRGIRRALDYLAPYADASREWPHQQINEMENARRDLAYLLRRASIAYREAQYEELLDKHLAAAAAQQRWQLLWPRWAIPPQSR
jgi:Alginate lyase